jgi:hypothetical protein
LRTLTLMTLGAALAVGTLTAPAVAADPAYLGTWKFAGAVVAPWADPARKPDGKEAARLRGKTITFKTGQITGPRPFPCKGPHYTIVDSAPEGLFEGAFDEMREKDKSVDPAKLAASLGFTGTSYKTLETGCDIDFHFVDATTMEIGLNDYVYTLKKQ